MKMYPVENLIKVNLHVTESDGNEISIEILKFTKLLI
jgi:hypothetical protein